MPSEGVNALARPAIPYTDAEVRAQVIKVLGDSGLSAEGIPFTSLIGDSSPRVQMFDDDVQNITLERQMLVLVSLDRRVEVVVKPARRSDIAAITISA